MAHPYSRTLKTIEVGGKSLQYYSLPELGDERIAKLPYCVRILLESALRNCDNAKILEKDVENILDWANTSESSTEIMFKPARVILQDFTGVPAVVDLAAMRSACVRLGGDPEKINPGVPVDLVIDHSVQVDKYRSKDALEANLEMEMYRNRERFVFLKWGAEAFDGLTIVPPGAGIVHQVNLEYLGRCVFSRDGVLYPDSLVGTDSHTPMINGLGIVGWGVGGIEAEAVMLGQPISMVLPKVVGYKLVSELSDKATATDLVLAITKNLRAKGVVGKFVEFYGPGVANLSISDRATISNMSPEMGCTISFFAVDNKTIDYMRLTGRTEEQLGYIEAYLRAQNLFRDYTDASQDAEYTDTLELDLSTVIPCLAGPKRPHDFVALTDMAKEFTASLSAPVGFKGFKIADDKLDAVGKFSFEDKEYALRHGSVVIAAITSCTNTANPDVMIAAGLVAKKAVEKGLTVNHWVKTSLAPGSGVVTEYLTKSGLLPYLETLGFNLVGYGCTTCIGNTGPLPDPIASVIEDNELVCCGVLSGNRNFEGRVSPHTRANFLASPPLVVAYALAGNVNIDLETEPLGNDAEGNPVFLKDIWPSREELALTVKESVLSEMFKDVYGKVTLGTKQWNELKASSEKLYPWDDKSTYIHHPPFFQSMGKEVDPVRKVDGATCLLNLGDFITTDHISPAGSISIKSPAARYLNERGVERRDFNSYGSRRGNDNIMARGTFANIRLLNKFIGSAAPKTVHHPTGDVLDVYDAAARYIESNTPLCILAGGLYGSGSSRDWAAKGVWMQNVKFVIASSYERIHRSNLVLFGVLPLQFRDGESADTLGLTGKEQFSVDITGLAPGSDVTVKVAGGAIEEFTALLRIDTDAELTYYNNGGVLNYVIRQSL